MVLRLLKMVRHQSRVLLAVVMVPGVEVQACTCCQQQEEENLICVANGGHG
jgi:hypothetical protein